MTKQESDVPQHRGQRAVVAAHDAVTLAERCLMVAVGKPVRKVINQHGMGIGAHLGFAQAAQAPFVVS